MPPRGRRRASGAETGRRRRQSFVSPPPSQAVRDRAAVAEACRRDADRVVLYRDRGQLMREDDRDARVGTDASPFARRFETDRLGRVFERDRIAAECLQQDPPAPSPRRLTGRRNAAVPLGGGTGALGRALSHRNARLFFGASAIAWTGLWIHRIAVAWLAWDLTRSAFWVGMVAFCDLAPAVLFSPIAGAIADRVDRVRLTMLSQAAIAAQAGDDRAAARGRAVEHRPAAAPGGGGRDRRQLLAAGAAEPDAGAGAAGRPAGGGRVQLALLQRRAFRRSRRSRGRSSPRRAWCRPSPSTPSPTSWRPRPCRCCGWTRRGAAGTRPTPRSGRKPSPASATPRGIPASGRSSASPPSRRCCCAACRRSCRPMSSACSRAGRTGLALLTASIGVGALASGLWVANRGRLGGATALAVGAVAAQAVATVGFVATGIFPFAMLCGALMGAAGSVHGISVQTLVQSASDPAMRGRVLSLWGMIVRACPACGALALGTAGELFGLRLPTLSAMALALLVAAWGFSRLPRMAATLEGAPRDDGGAAAAALSALLAAPGGAA